MSVVLIRDELWCELHGCVGDAYTTNVLNINGTVYCPHCLKNFLNRSGVGTLTVKEGQIAKTESRTDHGRADA